MSKDNIEIKNRKARFEFELQDDFIAGIQLLGTEIKSIRNGNASLNESYCVFQKDELYIRSLHVTEYEFGSDNNHNPKRDKKLLLKRQELDKLKKKVDEKGLTIVPLKLFINDKGLAKVKIALAQGKKLVDKRHSIKEKDTKRDLARLKKEFG